MSADSSSVGSDRVQERLLQVDGAHSLVNVDWWSRIYDHTFLPRSPASIWSGETSTGRHKVVTQFRTVAERTQC